MGKALGIRDASGVHFGGRQMKRHVASARAAAIFVAALQMTPMISGWSGPPSGLPDTSGVAIRHAFDVVAGAAPPSPSGVVRETESISFEENRGQWPDHVKFLVHGTGTQTFLTRDGATLVLPIDQTREEWSFRLVMTGASTDPQIDAIDKLTGNRSYMIGTGSSDRVLGVRSFQRVIYRDVWPSVDVEWYGGSLGLEFDIIAQPGAELDPIQFRSEGAVRTVIADDGQMVFHTPAGPVHKGKPVSYTRNSDGTRTAVETTYGLDLDGTIRFSVGERDASKVLVIDPIVYSTYLGGSSYDEWGTSVALDAQDSTYVAGRTRSMNFPVRGGLQPSQAGNVDAFVTKLNASGGLVYSTFLGGYAHDSASSIALGSDGSVFVTGWTESPNFPVQAALDPTWNGTAQEPFVAKLDPTGSSLVFSTFFASGPVSAIAVGHDGSAYIVGTTSSPFLYTVNPFQANLDGSSSAFVTKFAPDGRSLQFSTYLGGSGRDEANGVAVGPSGQAIVVGMTESANFPTLDAFTVTPPPGRNAFVTEFTADGTNVLHSTYLGGSGGDSATDVVLDHAGRVAVVGGSDSPDFPLKNPHLADPLAKSFLTVFEATLAELSFSTYQWGFHKAVSVGGGGHFVLAGATGASAYVSKVGMDGTLANESVIGGSAYDAANDVAVNATGTIFLTGYTSSTDFPTRNAFQPTYGGGGSDGFVTKFTFPRIVRASASRVVDSRPLCAGISQCGIEALGYTTGIATGATGSVFGIEMGAFEVHANRTCAHSDSCNDWLKLGLTIRGDVATVDGLSTTAGMVQWLAPNGTWQPVGGIPITVNTRHDPDRDATTLEFANLLTVPTAAFIQLNGDTNALTFRVVPRSNPWNLSNAPWEIEVAEAQVRLVARPVLMVHGWTPERFATNYADDDGSWQTQLIEFLRQGAIEATGQDPWQAYGGM